MNLDLINRYLIQKAKAKKVNNHFELVEAIPFFDEISIGWRLCLGGAHLLYGVNPDIAVFAKTIQKLSLN